MSELQSTYICVGGFYLPVLPTGPDGRAREIDGIHFFSAYDVARETSHSIAALHEAYAIFLKEVGDGIRGTETAMRARAMVRDQFRHLPDDKFEEFLVICRRYGFHPLSGQLRARSRYDEKSQCMVLDVELTTEGHFAIAERTAELLTVTGPEWCGIDGRWSDAWTTDSPPIAARVGVLRRGLDSPITATVYWREFADKLASSKDPARALADVAASLAIARAFADQMDGFSPDQLSKRQPDVADFDIATPLRPEDLPETARQFRLRLIDYGFQDPARQEFIMEEMRRRHPTLFKDDLAGWYRRALSDLRTNPDAFDATLPHDESTPAEE